jgi:hypothetical protein
METMFASSRRSLPPVPPPAPGSAAEIIADAAYPARDEVAAPTQATPIDEATPIDQDPAQAFVSRLRSAAREFAAAAGAQSAVVTEAVPPARHRRSRCRVVLRYEDGDQTDVIFLGPAGRPGADTHPGFDASIQRWLGTGQQREATWLVPDDDAPDGLAVDVTAWLAAS